MNDKQIHDIIDKKLDLFKKKNLGIRSVNRFGSVSDVYSPMTGNSKQIGFFGTPKVSQPTVTGSRGGNAALASLLTKLAALGLIVDGTSA